MSLNLEAIRGRQAAYTHSGWKMDGTLVYRDIPDLIAEIESLRSQIAARDEVIERLVAIEPRGWDDVNLVAPCIYCDAWLNNWGQGPHEPGCPWLAAQKLLAAARTAPVGEGTP